MRHDNEGNTTSKTGRGMNVAPGAPCESKNQRTRDFNKGRREYGPESRRGKASETKLQKPSASAGPNPLVTAHRQLIPKKRLTKICRLKRALTLVSTAATRTGAHCELAIPLPATRGVPDSPKPWCGAGHCQTDRRGTKDASEPVPEPASGFARQPFGPSMIGTQSAGGRLRRHHKPSSPCSRRHRRQRCH